MKHLLAIPNLIGKEDAAYLLLSYSPKPLLLLGKSNETFSQKAILIESGLTCMPLFPDLPLAGKWPAVLSIIMVRLAKRDECYCGVLEVGYIHICTA